ncbi:MAG: acyl carrier protein [Syntrophobacteraceae bacterium]
MEKILFILIQIRPESDYATSSDFLADGMLDSFDVVALVAALDSTFGISIDGTEIVPDNFRNLTAIRLLLERHGIR